MNTSESFESELISLGTTTIPTNTVEQSELCDLSNLCDGIFLKGFHHDLNQVAKTTKTKGFVKYLFDSSAKVFLNDKSKDKKATILVKCFLNEKSLEKFMSKLNLEKSFTNQNFDFATEEGQTIPEECSKEKTKSLRKSLSKMFTSSCHSQTKPLTELYVLKVFVLTSKEFRIKPEELELSYEAIECVKKIKNLDEASHFLKTYGTNVPDSTYELSCGYIRTVKVVGFRNQSLSELKSIAIQHLGDPNRLDLGSSQVSGTFQRKDYSLTFSSSIVGLPQDAIASFSFEEFLAKHQHLPMSFISKREILDWYPVPDLVVKYVQEHKIKYSSSRVVEYLKLAYFIRNFNYFYKKNYLDENSLEEFKNLASDFDLDLFWQDNIYRAVEKKFFHSINQADYSNLVDLSGTNESFSKKYIDQFKKSVEANFKLYSNRFSQVINLSLLHNIKYFPKDENLRLYLKQSRSNELVVFYYDRHMLNFQKEIFVELFSVFCYLIENSKATYTGMLVNCNHHYKNYPRILEFYVPPYDDSEESGQNTREEKEKRRKKIEDIVKNNCFHIEHMGKNLQETSESLNLEGKNIIALNFLNSFEILTSLNLKSNYLVYLNAYTFDQAKYASNLVILNLERNFIASIDAYAFKGLNSLRELSLSFNYLEKISDKMFNLDKLERLNLSHNRIKYIESGALKTMKNLKDLDLSYNLIKFKNVIYENIRSQILDYLFPSEIVRLNLAHNSLETISNNVFAVSKKLQVLDLRNNRIEEVDEMALNAMEQLRYLNLSKNSIRYLYESQFNNLSNLEELYLQGNQISLIRGQTFSNQVKLRYLLLNTNRLRTIEPRAFYNLHSLEALFLFNNYLPSDLEQRLVVRSDKFRLKNFVYLKDKKNYKLESLKAKLKENIFEADDPSIYFYKLLSNELSYDLE